MTTRTLCLCAIVSMAVWGAACGDDGPSEGACTTTIAPSEDDAGTIQLAFEEAASGDTICLAPGTYQLQRELALSSSRDVSLRGDGATRDDVVLDFSEQTVGNDGVTVTTPGFTIAHLTIKNTTGNGIVVRSERSVFRDIKVSWDAGSVTENGAYAVYPRSCSKTIVEDSEVTGASDAAIYVGSCEHAIVRRNTVYANVAGIEIENTRYADVYDNDVYDNTAGVLVFVLPNLDIKEARQIVVRDNAIYDNNRDNFAEDGTVVSFVPPGIGVLVIAAKEVEIADNDIRDNDSAGVLLVSFDIMTVLAGIENDDPEMDPYLEEVYVHGNTFADNGTEPAGDLRALGHDTLEDVLWDGDVRDESTDPRICLGASPPSFRNFAGPDFFAQDKQTTDTSGHECTLDPLPRLTSFDDMVAR